MASPVLIGAAAGCLYPSPCERVNQMQEAASHHFFPRGHADLFGHAARGPILGTDDRNQTFDRKAGKSEVAAGAGGFRGKTLPPIDRGGRDSRSRFRSRRRPPERSGRSRRSIPRSPLGPLPRGRGRLWSSGGNYGQSTLRPRRDRIGRDRSAWFLDRRGRGLARRHRRGKTREGSGVVSRGFAWRARYTSPDSREPALRLSKGSCPYMVLSHL